VKYTGKGKRKKKISTPYTVTVPTYEYYKIGSQRNGTSIWLFAAHKTGDKYKAVMKNEEEMEVESDADSTYNSIDFSAPEYRMMAKVHADRYQKKSIKLATMVDEEVDKTDRAALGLNQRQKGIWVLQATNMPAILIETGFITNHDDERYLNSEKGQQELAECIARAVKRYKEEMDHTILAPVQKIIEYNDAHEKYTDRTNNILKRIDLTQPDFKVDLYDDGDIDGDIVSVVYNDKTVIDKLTLASKAYTIKIPIKPEGINTLVFHAHNLGEFPPNTARLEILWGNKKEEMTVSSDLTVSSSVNIVFKQ